MISSDTMNYRIMICILLCACCMCCAKKNDDYPLLPPVDPHEPVTYYVDPNGDDAASGLTIDEALRTIGAAASLAKSGDTIIVREGTYGEQVSILSRSFTRAVTFIGQGSGRPVLDGAGSAAFGFLIYNTGHVVIDNFEIRNYDSAGIFALHAPHVTLRNNAVRDNGFHASFEGFGGEGYGIDVNTCRNALIEGNTVTGNGPGEENRLIGWLGTGINTYALRNSVIRGNVSSGNRGGGILVEDGINVLVEDNTAENNQGTAPLPYGGEWWCGGIWVDGGHDITVLNNRFLNNVAGAIISNENHKAVYGYVFTGNTMTQNRYGIQIYNFGVCPFPGPGIVSLEGNTVENNMEMDVFCTERL